MSERFFQLSPLHGIDDYFHLHYGEGLRGRLNPCEPIEDENLRLGIIDNNQISVHRLMLVPKDRKSIPVSIPETGETYEFTLPGKSAIICLTDDCGPEAVREVVTNQLSGKPDRRDHLHLATVQKIRDAGWVPYWVPLQLDWKILHTRLVARRTIEFGEDPTEEDARNLVVAFSKV